MKILFWNLYKKNNEKIVNLLLEERDVDIAIFAEHHNSNMEDLCNQNSNYVCMYIDKNCKVLAVCKKEIALTIRSEEARYSLYHFWHDGKFYSLAGLHLPARPHSNDHDRKAIIDDLLIDIKELERESGSANTMIIGDFNANPFDWEMISKYSLNAVLFKKLIEDRDTDCHQGKKYKRFYNPMLLHLMEENQVYGSYYRTEGMDSLHWYTYDQFLVRKELCNSIGSITFCKSIKGISLVTRKGCPDKRISDHLPLIVEVQI